MEELRIVGWTSFDEDYPMTLDEEDVFQQKLHLVAKEIAQNGYCFSGEEHQNSLTGMPVFSDGTAFRASMRTWGYIMAKVYSTSNKTYNYMDFYMSLENSKMPESKAIDVLPKDVDEELPGCTVEEDQELISQSISMGMGLMTTDKVIKIFYEIMSK